MLYAGGGIITCDKRVGCVLIVMLLTLVIEKKPMLIYYITLVDKISLTKFSRRLINIFRIIFECWIRKKYSFLKVNSISPNSQVFPRNQPFSAVFAIKNIRKRDRVILVFLTERILSYDHLAKEKTQKSWKLDFWQSFKVWNFEFLVNFWKKNCANFNFFVKYASFATRVVLWFLAVLFWEILAKKFWTYH